MLHKSIKFIRPYKILMFIIPVFLLFSVNHINAKTLANDMDSKLNNKKNSIFFTYPDVLPEKPTKKEVSSVEYFNALDKYTFKFCPEKVQYMEFIKNEISSVILNTKNSLSKDLNTVSKSLQNQKELFNKIQERAKNPDECGVNLKGILFHVYNNTGNQRKAKQTYQETKNLAIKGNPYAIFEICNNHWDEKKGVERIIYCKKALSDSSGIYNVKAIDINRSLVDSYMSLKQLDKAITVVNKSDRSNRYLYLSAIEANADIRYETDRNDKFILITYIEVLKHLNSVGVKYRLADMYLNGYGTSKNPSKAIEYYTQLLREDKKNLDFIYNNLGIANERLGCFRQAFIFYLKSAKMNNFFGEMNISRLYLLGKGTLQNDTEAFAWASLAAANNFNNPNQLKLAMDFKESIRKRLFKEEYLLHNKKLAEGEELAKKYYELYAITKTSQPRQGGS